MNLNAPSLGTSLFIWSLNIALVYSNALWLFPRYLLKRRYAAYALGLLGVMLAFGALRYGMHFYLLPSLDLKTEPMYTPAFREFMAQTYYRGTIFLGYSLVYAYATHAIGLLRQLRVQEHQPLPQLSIRLFPFPHFPSRPAAYGSVPVPFQVALPGCRSLAKEALRERPFWR